MNVAVISHVMREGNQRPDALANEAIRREDSQVYRDQHDLPARIKGVSCLDKAGVPKLRSRKL